VIIAIDSLEDKTLNKPVEIFVSRDVIGYGSTCQSLSEKVPQARAQQ